jgi:hypothetical protein
MIHMPEKSTMGTTTNNNVEQAFLKPVITQRNDGFPYLTGDIPRWNRLPIP